MLKAIKFSWHWDEEFDYMLNKVIISIERFVIQPTDCNQGKMEHWISLYIGTAKKQTPLNEGQYLFRLRFKLECVLDVQRKTKAFWKSITERNVIYGSIINRIKELERENHEEIMGGAMKTLRDKEKIND